MSTTSRIENNDLLFFIDLIEKYTFLWDKKDSKFKDKVATENAWSSIATIMEISVKEVQELWEYLKRKFVRERRLNKNIPSGSGASNSNNKWELYDRLGFLNRVLQSRRTKGNIIQISKTSQEWEGLTVGDDGLLSPSSSITETENSVIDEEEEISSLTQPVEVVAEYSTTNESAAAAMLRRGKNVSKRCKREEPLQDLIGTCTSIGRDIKNLMERENIDERDEDYQFLVSLQPSLKKVPHKRKLHLKAKILLLLVENVEDSDEN